jgi:hypothetical protein
MSRITTVLYTRKVLVVDAVRITKANFDDIAEWCQGEVRQDEVPGQGTGKKYIRIRAHNPKNPRQTKAFVGDWILYTDRGYKVYTNKAFHASFDESSLVDFPREEGDTIVIGPNCFAEKTDGGVLCWKGVNYVPQEKPGDIIMGSEEVLPGLTLNDAVAWLKENHPVCQGADAEPSETELEANIEEKAA